MTFSGLPILGKPLLGNQLYGERLMKVHSLQLDSRCLCGPISVLTKYHSKGFETILSSSYSKLHIQQYAGEIHKLIFKINVFMRV